MVMHCSIKLCVGPLGPKQAVTPCMPHPNNKMIHSRLVVKLLEEIRRRKEDKIKEASLIPSMICGTNREIER